MHFNHFVISFIANILFYILDCLKLLTYDQYKYLFLILDQLLLLFYEMLSPFLITFLINMQSLNTFLPFKSKFVMWVLVGLVHVNFLELIK